MTTMGKEASLEGLEFDGETVLCRVCGDKASGFHYGVHACEGCKGFFRRSIQQKIQYRPCLKNQQCNIMRVNRNRCQYCRLKKCIAVGMSRDAVRFGRVPKKEKARIIEQMQKVNLQSSSTQMSSILISTQDLVQSVILAHRHTCDLAQDKARLMRDKALQTNDYVDCPAHMACPLNLNIGNDSTDNQDWSDFSEHFAPAIKSIVDFAKLIPGFMLLNQDDQVTLLKAATFEVLLVRMACLFDPETSTMMFANGKLFKRSSAALSNSVGFLLDSMFDFAERFNKLNLTDEELALFSAVVLLSPDRPGLRNIEQIEKVQNKLTESLQNMINTGHKEDSTLFAKLLMKTTDLRTLNALHSEKSIAPFDRPGGDSSDTSMEVHDPQMDTRSEDSNPSDTSSVTMNSASGMDTSSSYDGSNPVLAQRLAADSLPSQQLVLKTPYGTFYREDTGFYGLVPDQPRRRCHTLEPMSRPRLRTIEEVNKRRYTLDREYINKMVSKLSDKLEKRAAIQGDSLPASIVNSAASSPIPEEHYAYLNTNRDFIPISTPDSSACSSRASPAFLKDSLQPFSSSPNSPRPRSGSMGTADDIGPMRPRCSSFHMNSEGHAARSSSHPYAASNDLDFLSADNQRYLMNAEMRRGSVGASYGLHARKKSLLVDRHPAYLSRVPDALYKAREKQSFLPSEVNHTKSHKIGSGGSAFDQVPQISVTKQAPPLPTWTSQGRAEPLVPPVVSVTGPQDDSQPRPTEQGPSTVSGKGPDVPVPGAGGDGGTTRDSERNSPDMDMQCDNSCNGEVFHKKFDKLRKHTVPHSIGDESRQMANLSLIDREQAPGVRDSQLDTSKQFVGEIPNQSKEAKLKTDKPKLSAVEAHPQLLAHLNAAPAINLQYKPAIHPVYCPATQTRDSNQENVVLTVPQGMYADRTSPVVSPGNGRGSQSILEHMMMGKPANVVANEEKFQGVSSGNHATTMSHLKDKLLRKYDSAENLSVVGVAGGVDDVNCPGFQTSGQQSGVEDKGNIPPQFFPTQQFMPGFIPPQQFSSSTGPVAMAMYHPQVVGGGGYPQGQPVMMHTQYNQHLASMHQLVYGGPGQVQQKRLDGAEEGQPLNLTQTPLCHDPRLDNMETDRKIKEEVMS